MTTPEPFSVADAVSVAVTGQMCYVYAVGMRVDGIDCILSAPSYATMMRLLAHMPPGAEVFGIETLGKRKVIVDESQLHAPAAWVSVNERLPADETPVLVMRKGKLDVGELRWETPTFEETFKEFRYWAHPDEHWIEEDRDEVTHWMQAPASTPLPQPEVQEVTMKAWEETGHGDLG